MTQTSSKWAKEKAIPSNFIKVLLNVKEEAEQVWRQSTQYAYMWKVAKFNCMRKVLVELQKKSFVELQEQSFIWIGEANLVKMKEQSFSWIAGAKFQ